MATYKELAALAETAAFACGALLPIEGSMESGYRVSSQVPDTIRALPEEVAEAAQAICDLYAALNAR